MQMYHCRPGFRVRYCAGPNAMLRGLSGTIQSCNDLEGTVAVVWDNGRNTCACRPSSLILATERVKVEEPVVEKRTEMLPADADARGEYPMWDGLFAYFGPALAEVARNSMVGNKQHNPGEQMHWDRSKSKDHANKIIRHLMDAGKVDKDGVRHATKVVWRALALLQEELEREEGAPVPPNVTNA